MQKFWLCGQWPTTSHDLCSLGQGHSLTCCKLNS
jgi:hypothetical protein